jgi:hypothetical protein
MYGTGDTGSFDMTQAGQPQQPSAQCLVCHNGIFSSLVNYPGPGSRQEPGYDFIMNATFWAMLDIDLRDDHPISFTYAPGLDADYDFFPTSQACQTPLGPSATRRCLPSSGGAGVGAGTGFIGYPLYGAAWDQFECATCHSVHDTVSYATKQFVNGLSFGTQVFFLRRDNSNSDMCGDCHRNRWGAGHGAAFQP